MLDDCIRHGPVSINLRQTALDFGSCLNLDETH